MDSIFRLEDAFISVGVVDITIRHMGGMIVLLKFDSVDIKKRYLENGAPWLSTWFEELNEWKMIWSLKKRLVWLSVEGLLLNAWNVTNLEVLQKGLDQYYPWTAIQWKKRFLIEERC
ncbi:hypothetical protein L1049_006079 [Liquidambar formosana]|uniref:DUF4283 domain-containing protein n=1 Tax=Liquidambar formosana TaxID=63359 RepID=A0AAP0RGM1_LIQFO